MGKLLSYDGYTRADALADCCGISSDTREVCQLALDSDDEGLKAFALEQLEDAQAALLACERWGCECHGWDRVARDVIGHAITNEMQRLAELDELEADAKCHGGACACNQCV